MILYYDKNVVFATKPVGVSSEGEGMPRLLKEEFEKEGIKTEIYPLHRLDMAVSGVMIFARNKEAAGKLGDMVAKNQGVKKEYLAVIHGEPENPKGIFEDLLFKDSAKNKSYVVKKERKGVKKASLEYEVIESRGGLTLVKIVLHTGRTHQIRVQFSSRKMPLFGDGKYGGKDNGNIALFCHKICVDGVKTVSALPCGEYPWNLFDNLF